MEYVYAALLVHNAGGTLNESTLSKVVTAAGGKADDAQAKALLSALEGKNIAEIIKNATAAPVAVAAPASGGSAPVAKKEEKKEEANPEEAAAGLGALFG